jgi:hypothetical protein
MALPFEGWRLEDRMKERADRLRRRDTWPRSDERLQYLYRAAVQEDRIREVLEEALVAEEDEAPGRLRTAAREAVRGLMELRKQGAIAVKYGFKVAEKMYEASELLELSEAEDKKLKALMKEAEESGKGKARAKPYERPTGSGHEAAGGGGWGWYGGGYAPSYMTPYGPTHNYSGYQPWGQAR